MMKARKLPVVMGVIFGFAANAMAADLPKEGTFSGTYTAVGTYKAIKVGDRALSIADELGVQVTNGVADHMTFHCWGTGEVVNGEAAATDGYCVAMDPTGDLIGGKFANDKHKVGEAFKGLYSFVAWALESSPASAALARMSTNGSEFRPLVEGTYVSYVTFECHSSYRKPTR